MPMSQLAPIALYAWPAVCLLLYWRFDGRAATAVAVLGGWAVLPVAVYPEAFVVPHHSEFPVMGLAHGGLGWLTKASVIGSGALLGALVFDRQAFGRLRLSAIDVVAIAWCAVPLVSGLFNHVPVGDVLLNTAHTLSAWGAVYVLGRVYFSDPTAWRELLQGLAIASLVHLPIFLFEFVLAPAWYEFVYGPHPYATAGAQRYFNTFRPMGFMEDGNQMGMWLAGGAVAAAALWRAGEKRAAGLPAGAVALVNGAMLLASQSVGAIALAAAALAWLWLVGRVRVRGLMVAGLLGVLVLLGLRITGVLHAERFVTGSAFGQKIKRALKEADRGSFGWRLKREEEHLPVALDRPVLGWGDPHWCQKEPPGRPWSLWSLTFGAYGGVGLVLLGALLCTGAVRLYWSIKPLAGRAPPGLEASALAAVLLMAAGDALLNSALVLPWVLAVGALAGASGWFAGRGRPG